MIKSKKILFTLILAVTACLFTACPDPNGVTQTDDPPKQQTPAQLTPSLDYDKTVYKITMDAVINSSKDFVNQSIKSQASRAAELSEDDTWQGYIDYMWNVPSNIYGTSTDPGDNRLEMHGEDLGTLQPLVHSTDENGNYRKAVFEYKGHLYYVLDKGNEDPNNSYVVLSSEDDFNHIVFDQAGKIGSDDWSNFKIWVWEKDLNNELYRRGNLGYAYTLRNVEMLDGSFATITVAGFNYYHYGFRVWIKETDGQTAKPELPENTQDNQYKVESAYTPEKLQTRESDEDFIYEVVNNTSGDLTVSNYIRDWSIEYFDFGIIAQTEDVLIKKGESFQFKYKTSELAKYDNDKHSVVLGCYFTPEGKWRCGGWENNLNSKNKIHTVTVTDSEEYCMDGKNSWRIFNLDELKENTEHYDAVYEIVNNSSYDFELAFALRYWNNDTKTNELLAKTDEIQVEAGDSVQFKYSTDELLKQYNANSPFNYGLCVLYDGTIWAATNLNSKNQLYTVTLKDSEEYGVDFDTSYKHLDTPDSIHFKAVPGNDGIKLTVDNIPKDTNYIRVYESGTWITIYQVQNYNASVSLPEKIEFCDEFVQQGNEYTYCIQYKTNSSSNYENFSIDPVKATGGKGELSFTIEAKKEGVILSPDKSILDSGLNRLSIRREPGDEDSYGYQAFGCDLSDLSENSYLTDYFVTSGKEYTYKLECQFNNKIEIDKNNYINVRYNPRANIATITIPENCGLGELSLTTFPKASWDSNAQKVTFTQTPVISTNYPENTTLQEVGFMYHKENNSSNNYYIDYYYYSPQEAISLNWKGGPGKYYASSPELQGSRGYVICINVDNTYYQVYDYKEHMFDDMPQEITIQ